MQQYDVSHRKLTREVLLARLSSKIPTLRRISQSPRSGFVAVDKKNITRLNSAPARLLQIVDPFLQELFNVMNLLQTDSSIQAIYIKDRVRGREIIVTKTSTSENQNAISRRSSLQPSLLPQLRTMIRSYLTDGIMCRRQSTGLYQHIQSVLYRMPSFSREQYDTECFIDRLLKKATVRYQLSAKNTQAGKESDLIEKLSSHVVAPYQSAELAEQEHACVSDKIPAHKSDNQESHPISSDSYTPLSSPCSVSTQSPGPVIINDYFKKTESRDSEPIIIDADIFTDDWIELTPEKTSEAT